MSLPDTNIKEILLSGNYVSAEDLQKAEVCAKESRSSVTDCLMREHLITKSLLGEAIAEYHKMLFVDFNTHPVQKEQIIKVSEEISKKYRFILFSEEEKKIVLCTDSIEKKPEVPAEVQSLFPKKKIVFSYVFSEDLEMAFLNYRQPLETRFAKIIENQKRLAPEIIDEILGDAVVFRASDVHFDPQEMEVVIRFRIDGILHEAGRIDKKYYENILNRFKVQAHLRTDEHFSPQDGAMRYVKYGEDLDIRISLIPTLDGEKTVLRLLSEYVRSFTYADVGLSARDQGLLTNASKKPFGMILVTGPTGSGKTTTLYSLLKVLNRPEVNIATIEDPVEYKILGVNHIQVNSEKNITFAHGLRSIVRQDPDIILVGEIRDTETAEIAVNAALTGHLLLSTFHANDAETAIPRLLDMGVEPFLLASTLEIIVAQRLVRRICEKCRYSYVQDINKCDIPGIDLKKYFATDTINLYVGKGCELCNKTGYKGRIALFEVIEATEELQDLMLHHPSSKQVWELAHSQGARSMFEDGIEKVKAGITTFDELLRIAPPSRMSSLGSLTPKVEPLVSTAVSKEVPQHRVFRSKSISGSAGKKSVHQIGRQKKSK
jgi:type II secretory ATPase GspE/PulE/Tfp pilus assembly ATPase PilB-like protein